MNAEPSLKFCMEGFAGAAHLVCRDQRGILWRIKIVERDTNGLPSPTTFRCSAGREFGGYNSGVWFEFVDEQGSVLLTMRPRELQAAQGGADTRIELQYNGIRVGD